MSRTAFTAELDQLRLQVELMAVRVDQNLERMREVLERGDVKVVDVALAADDEIDAMNVSLTERCYDLLRREAPVASDLRFVVSVLRVLSELERIGDLALRVIKLAPDFDLLVSNPPTYDILRAMDDQVIERYRDALRAWASMDLQLATELATNSRSMDLFYERLLAELLRLSGDDAARVAIATFATGRSLERISDHAAIIGARLRYLLTGDPDHLAAEVR
ncbi:MAG TPA: phosphate signaling complex protein PhoU [Acidimicrobiales bacterium]|jgi:phosphate transport system protein|nr:phosphate signaling complex protein PhoU [Acidimicrobiales bacterium]